MGRCQGGATIERQVLTFIRDRSKNATAKGGDVSNVVIAVGAVFTLAFSLWQHQQTLNREKIQSKPKMRLVGAPISKVADFRAAMHAVQVEFQFLNGGKNAAANLRFRIFMGLKSNPELLVSCRDEVMAMRVLGRDACRQCDRTGQIRAVRPPCASVQGRQDGSTRYRLGVQDVLPCSTFL